MVLFKCKTCAASVMQRDVGKHVGKCSGPLTLTCVDCHNDFHGQQYEKHTSCFGPRTAPIPLPAEMPKVAEKPKVWEMSKPEEMTKVTKKRKGKNMEARKKATFEQAAKKRAAKKNIDAADPALQQQWKDAAITASKDPTLTLEQKYLLKNTSKQQLPKKITYTALKKSLRSGNAKFIQASRRIEFAYELLNMITSELRNINGATTKDGDTETKELTKNQRLISGVLTAAEAPGLTAAQRLLLAASANDDDEGRRDKLMRNYVHTAWKVSVERSDAKVQKAFSRFEAEFNNIRGLGSKAGDRTAVNGNGLGEKPANGLKEDTASPSVKKEKHKKHKVVEEESKEDGVEGAVEASESNKDTPSKKSKKSKRPAEEEIVSNGDQAEISGSVAEATPLKKSKKRSAGQDEDAADPLTNGEQTGDAASTKIKKNKKQKSSAVEEISELIETTALSESPSVVAKKKKAKQQEEITFDEAPRKKSKKIIKTEIEI